MYGTFMDAGVSAVVVVKVARVVSAVNVALVCGRGCVMPNVAVVVALVMARKLVFG